MENFIEINKALNKTFYKALIDSDNKIFNIEYMLKNNNKAIDNNKIWNKVQNEGRSNNSDLKANLKNDSEAAE